MWIMLSFNQTPIVIYRLYSDNLQPKKLETLLIRMIQQLFKSTISFSQTDTQAPTNLYRKYEKTISFNAFLKQLPLLEENVFKK